ncbi:MAG: hypothetical protein J6X55_17710, partial [Victivallales bacterium]|nr:hypothetical protein [Victivallales bacterium]
MMRRRAQWRLPLDPRESSCWNARKLAAAPPAQDKGWWRGASGLFCPQRLQLAAAPPAQGDKYTTPAYQKVRGRYVSVPMSGVIY